MTNAPRNLARPVAPLGLPVARIVRLAATRGHCADTARLAVAVQHALGGAA